MLYTKVVEVEERVAPEWLEFVQDPSLAPAEYGGELVEGVNGSKLRVLQPLSEWFTFAHTSHLALQLICPPRLLYLNSLVSPLIRGIDTAQVQTDLEALYAEGYRSIAIVLCHSYLYPLHEKAVESIAQSVGFPHISVSSDLQAMINLVSRGTSATADAYLTPEVRRYLDGFAEGFKGKLQQEGGSGTGCRVSFMQSDGSLCDFRKFSGLKAILCEWRPHQAYGTSSIMIAVSCLHGHPPYPPTHPPDHHHPCHRHHHRHRHHRNPCCHLCLCALGTRRAKRFAY